ncbi:MAG: lytic transglycosylase domain-containing protein [Candidatus Calescibacterium sp.]|nr:lytic transglycosylase domain-containing protein [Candidatus Calescibacterium sp.]MCX7972602.1 lytic transglycosylase domain-containing protein [bacterium]MDW8195763.1 lytic transglycosylase domain-containing protein [Candidatus Calescibacterium sp.]
MKIGKYTAGEPKPSINKNQQTVANNQPLSQTLHSDQSKIQRIKIQEKITCNIAKAGGIEDKYDSIICEASQKYNIDPNLIKAVIKKESNFNPKAQSEAGAKGLMQITDITAKHLRVKNPFDPKQNIMGGAKYLAQLLDQFNNDLELAIAAYNAGPGNVKKYGGIPPFKETQHYVQKVLEFYENYKKLAE